MLILAGLHFKNHFPIWYWISLTKSPWRLLTLQTPNWSFFLLIQSLTGKWNVAESLVLCSDLDFPTVLGQHPHTGLATSNYFGCPIPGWRLCPPWETETSPIFQREPLSKRACIAFKKSWGTNTEKFQSKAACLSGWVHGPESDRPKFESWLSYLLHK